MLNNAVLLVNTAISGPMFYLLSIYFVKLVCFWWLNVVTEPFFEIAHEFPTYLFFVYMTDKLSLFQELETV